MSENTYEYECMRAELLGAEKPTLEEYMSKQRENESQQVEEEEQDTKHLKTMEQQSEDMGHISGGLHELSNILSVTQKKIDRFKASCGSLTNLLKFKIGSGASSAESSAEDKIITPIANEGYSQEETETHEFVSSSDPRKGDLTKALDNHVDKLDSLISKADECHLSMSQQNTQMKKFLK